MAETPNRKLLDLESINIPLQFHPPSTSIKILQLSLKSSFITLHTALLEPSRTFVNLTLTLHLSGATSPLGKI
ncbi:hypothetical protein FIBSPDRAFT_970374 [Athelia psychrophila]|uniref:Uncharacterized protein n=1 Tax=Athelia psychrophila TaxID=1759441 RepID=A0A167SQX3_9AGAM|nr:hypothetical protein FIBSPDRAFT_970374 [Fibularhizoctonia sp. CBS 109695]